LQPGSRRLDLRPLLMRLAVRKSPRETMPPTRDRQVLEHGKQLLSRPTDSRDCFDLSDRSKSSVQAMELRQLHHFIAVAEELNFTRAADRVHIVQSALSSSIRGLEDELRARLFVRSTRQVRLTPAGRAFLEKAREALRVIDIGRETVADIAGLRRGCLSIGTVHSLPAFLDLPTLISRYHAVAPGIEVRLRQGDAAGLMERLRSGRLDLAFLP